MARNNKYTSLNFNDIYEKKPTPASAHRSNSSSSSPISNKTILSNSRIHGHMLVLSRPTPKPISIPQPQTNPIQSPDTSVASQQEKSRPEPDSISLRPQGRTGSSPAIYPNPLASPPNSTKADRFVPPHLRPGFVGREEKLATDFQKGRPKSGGGYERMMVGGEGDSGIFINRPRSGGARPRSSG